jgi:hypothetical protein
LAAIFQFLRNEIIQNTPCFAKVPLFPPKKKGGNEPGTGSNAKGRDPMQTD